MGWMTDFEGRDKTIHGRTKAVLHNWEWFVNIGLNGTVSGWGHVQALWAWWWILHDRAMSWPGEQLSYCYWHDCSLLQLTRQLILEDLRVVKTLCVPCFPPHYDIVNKFVHMYHTALSHHVSRMHLLVWFSSLIPTLLFIRLQLNAVDMCSCTELGGSTRNASMPQAHVWGVAGSDLGIDANTPKWGFLYFSSFPQADTKILPLNRPWPFLFTPFPILIH